MRRGAPVRYEGPVLCALLALTLAWVTLGVTPSGTLAQQEGVAADEGAATAPEKAAEGKEKERKRSEEPVEIKFAEHVQIQEYDDPDHRVLLLEGSVHLQQEDVEVFGDVVTLDQGQETAEATGNLRVVDPENVIVGDLLTADFAEGRITLTGNVRLVHEETEEEEGGEEAANAGAPERVNAGESGSASPGGPAREGNGEPKAGKDERKKRTVVTCNQMHYYYDDKRAICMGNVVAKQEEDTVYAHRAIYDEEADILSLTGDVRMEREDGSVFRFKGAVINVEERTIQGEFMANSILVREKKEEGEAKESAGAKEAGTGAPEKPGQASGERVGGHTGAASPEGGR